MSTPIRLFDQVLLPRLKINSDIAEHLPTLYMLASRCSRIVEFGVRTGNSTIAMLAAIQARGRRDGILYSYDIRPLNQDLQRIQNDFDDCWEFKQADTAKLEGIPFCDMLFIDTLHTAAQVEAELRHHGNVFRWIVFHDTVLFGTEGEGGEGINVAIQRFVDRNADRWRIFREYRHNNGLLIVERIQ